MQPNGKQRNSMDNPFIIKAYESKELFCDREEELQLMLRNCVNQTDMTLISQRRMGKTGLILRLFDELQTTRPDIHTIYVDIFASRNIDDFIKLLAEATIKSFQPKTTIGERLMTFIKSLRPQLSFDNITGEPQLQIAYQTAHEKEYTLRGLFDFLDSQGLEHLEEPPLQVMGFVSKHQMRWNKIMFHLIFLLKSNLIQRIITQKNAFLFHLCCFFPIFAP